MCMFRDPREFLPKRDPKGIFFVLIITSGRVLRWPYRKEADPPMYLTRKDAERILKSYVAFANNSSMTRIKRTPEEFEVVELSEKSKELIS